MSKFTKVKEKFSNYVLVGIQKQSVNIKKFSKNKKFTFIGVFNFLGGTFASTHFFPILACSFFIFLAKLSTFATLIDINL